MHALRQEILPPSGVEFSASLNLTPATIEEITNTHNPTIRHEFTARALCNVVVARSNLLRIFEVREELAPIHTHTDEERERRSSVRKGTEAVEGEVAMDGQGEGFVNIAKVICMSMYSSGTRDCSPGMLQINDADEIASGSSSVKKAPHSRQL